jgi:hypothetical protein
MVRRVSSPPRSSREEERRLNLRTLVIASAASASAALVTSRLWIAGTWIAAAMTPVIVALVSEMLHRPTERITRSLTSDSPALPDPEAPARRVAERMRVDVPATGAPPPDARRPDPDALRPDPDAPVRIYRTETARPQAGRKRQIAYRAVLVTAALAFAIGVAVLTVPELIAGSSFGKNDGRTTLFSGNSKKRDSEQNQSQPNTPEQTDTTQQPTTTDETTPQTDTETTPTTTTPPGEPTTTSTTPTTTTP